MFGRGLCLLRLLHFLLILGVLLLLVLGQVFDPELFVLWNRGQDILDDTIPCEQIMSQIKTKIEKKTTKVK